MKNKELLNICYKFFNRFIIADELIEKLKSLDTKSLSKAEKESIYNLIIEINKIAKKIPNIEDDFVINKKKNIKEIMKILENSSKNVIDEKLEKLLNTRLNSLKEDYNKEMDSYERWFAITDCINNNEYFNTCFDNLSDYELLEFIAQNIQAPFPPQLNQEEFDNLVKVGVENDEREWLWRLAFNYEGRNIKFDSIVTYFIKIKDGYYIAELISAVGDDLDIDSLIDKINDKDLIEDLKGRKDVIEHYITEEQFSKLINKLD